MIVPDQATSSEWDEDGTELTFQLRHGVKLHDGQPFTAKDVKWSLELRLGTAPEKLRPSRNSVASYAGCRRRGFI